MKQIQLRYILVLLIFFFSVPTINGTLIAETSVLNTVNSPVRIMSYNILNGGQGAGRNDEWLDPIIQENPDILVINEAAFWEANGYVDHYCQILNEHHWPNEVNYTGYVTTAGGSPAIAILSRFQISSFETLLLGDTSRTFAHAEIIVQEETVHVFGAHLKSGNSAYDRAAREDQILALKGEINKLSPNAIVFVVGDFNSYSPVDCDDPAINPNWDYVATWSEAEAGTIAAETLLAEGFIDVFRELNPTEPGWTCFDTHPDANYSAFGRIDYQWVSGNMVENINHSDRIYDHVKAQIWGSDHIPLVSSYWIGEKPTSTTTTTVSTNNTESISISEILTTSQKTSINGLIFFSTLSLLLLHRRKRKKI